MWNQSTNVAQSALIVSNIATQEPELIAQALKTLAVSLRQHPLGICKDSRCPEPNMRSKDRLRCLHIGAESRACFGH